MLASQKAMKPGRERLCIKNRGTTQVFEIQLNTSLTVWGLVFSTPHSAKVFFGERVFIRLVSNVVKKLSVVEEAWVILLLHVFLRYFFYSDYGIVVSTK